MIKVYNSLSRKKESLKPRRPGKIGLFVCGPTVYDFAHIGHARTYIVFDMIAKYLSENGFDVFYLQNITDVDDKIINRAAEQNIPWQKLARRFEEEYLKDMKTLKISSVRKYARATDNIKEIISQTERLLKKGFAYKTKDGIYYNISKFKNYGRLSGRTALQAEDAISRIDESREKKNRGDFCLWKFSLAAERHKNNGEPKWQSPWGWGRPGWHIEDTAITEKYLGPQYDIHGGGRDLIFPHHEAEIAQMEAISGKRPLVKYWLHTGFLTAKKEKMSKSLGNFVTIQDFLKTGTPRVLRYFFLKTHYRSPIDYDLGLIFQCEKELERMDEFIGKCRMKKSCLTDRQTRLPTGQAKLKTTIQNSKLVNDLITVSTKKFEKAMEDNFNTPEALAEIFRLVNQGNALLDKGVIGKEESRQIIQTLAQIDRFFNFIFWPKKKEKIPDDIMALARERKEYRKQKNWEKADECRKMLEKRGYEIEDTKQGPKLKSKEQ